MLRKSLKKLNGNKTYLVCTGMVVFASLGVILGYLEPQKGFEIMFEAAGLAGIRNSIK